MNWIMEIRRIPYSRRSSLRNCLIAVFIGACLSASLLGASCAGLLDTGVAGKTAAYTSPKQRVMAVVSAGYCNTLPELGQWEAGREDWHGPTKWTAKSPTLPLLVLKALSMWALLGEFFTPSARVAS